MMGGKSETLNPKPPNDLQGDEPREEPDDGARCDLDPFKCATVCQLHHNLIKKPDLKAHHNHSGSAKPGAFNSGCFTDVFVYPGIRLEMV